MRDFFKLIIKKKRLIILIKNNKKKKNSHIFFFWAKVALPFKYSFKSFTNHMIFFKRYF